MKLFCQYNYNIFYDINNIKHILNSIFFKCIIMNYDISPFIHSPSCFLINSDIQNQYKRLLKLAL